MIKSLFLSILFFTSVISAKDRLIFLDTVKVFIDSGLNIVYISDGKCVYAANIILEYSNDINNEEYTNSPWVLVHDGEPDESN